MQDHMCRKWRLMIKQDTVAATIRCVRRADGMIATRHRMRAIAAHHAGHARHGGMCGYKARHKGRHDNKSHGQPG